MTNDEMISMAREAGLEDWTVHGRIENKWVCLEKFASLVAEQVMLDAVIGGIGVTLGGERIDQASIYKQAEPVKFTTMRGEHD